MSNKGGQFERDFCRQLTAWWMGPLYDGDVVFWRTSQSGGRVTSRRKKGRAGASAHCGDIAALDGIGAPLTRLITWELKNGYSSAHLHELLDRPKKAAPKYEQFVRQAMTAAENAHTPYWAVVHHRPKREDVLTIPASLWVVLGGSVSIDPPVFSMSIPTMPDLVSCRVDAFFRGVLPVEIRHLARYHLDK